MSHRPSGSGNICAIGGFSPPCAQLRHFLPLACTGITDAARSLRPFSRAPASISPRCSLGYQLLHLVGLPRIAHQQVVGPVHRPSADAFFACSLSVLNNQSPALPAAAQSGARQIFPPPIRWRRQPRQLRHVMGWITLPLRLRSAIRPPSRFPQRGYPHFRHSSCTGIADAACVQVPIRITPFTSESFIGAASVRLDGEGVRELFSTPSRRRDRRYIFPGQSRVTLSP